MFSVKQRIIIYFFVNYFDSYGTRKHEFALMDMIVFIFTFHTMSTRERFLLIVRSEVTLNLRIDWSQVNQSLKTLEIQFPQAVRNSFAQEVTNRASLGNGYLAPNSRILHTSPVFNFDSSQACEVDITPISIHSIFGKTSVEIRCVICVSVCVTSYSKFPPIILL